MSDFSWFWATEWGRDNILRDELASQAETTQWLARSQRDDTERLRKQLGNLEGDMSSRLDALSNAFVAYVELDAVRQQLAGFPANEQVRRHAREDLAALVAGRQPAPRTEGASDYWLVPALAALRPDGSVDQQLADQAIELDAEAARTFLLVTRAALGDGTGLDDELIAVMAPHDEAGVPTWTAEQVMVWAATLRGAFGPDALAALQPTIEPALRAEAADGWQTWVAGQVTGLGTTREERQVSWVADQLAAVVEPVGDVEQDTGWRMNWTPPPGSVDKQDAGTVSSTADPQAMRESNRQMLLQIAEALISQGAPGERDLLARATELRAELSGSKLATPARGQATESEAAEQPTRPAASSVLSQVRRLALDPNASPHDRRLLWSWLAPHLRGWLTEVAELELPAPEVTQVGGRKTLVATSEGVVNEGELELARAQVVQDYPVSPAQRYGLLIAGIAAVALVLGGALVWYTEAAAWWALIIAGALGALGGWYLHRQHRRQLSFRQAALQRLTEDVQNALTRSARTDQSARQAHEQLTEAARRALSLLPD